MLRKMFAVATKLSTGLVPIVQCRSNEICLMITWAKPK